MLVVNLVVTEECNLGCKYCYMKNKKQYMKKDTVDLFFSHIDSILKDFDQNSFSITFFGGEPLLNYDLIQYTVGKLKNDSRLKSITTLTNGLLLTKEKLEWLRAHKVNVSLSFDGIGNINNRVFLNNNSSLDYYLKNKELFRYISPKVMISPTSLNLCENYKFFINEFSNYFPDFTLVRDNIWSEEDILKFEKELQKLTELQIKNIKNGIPTLVGFYSLAFSDIITSVTYGKRSFGCFAGVNGLAVFPNNKIYPCGRFGSHERFLLYKMTPELVKHKNIIKEDESLYNPKKIEKCIDCDLYKYCNAGCSFCQIKRKPVSKMYTCGKYMQALQNNI